MKFKLLLFVVFSVNLYSNEVVSLLKRIESNHQLHFSYQNISFVCTPYGIETISQLAERTDVNSTCMQYLNDFRRSNPKEKFFAETTLSLHQQYSVQGIDSLCLLLLSSDHSYNEALLAAGYARKPNSLIYQDKILEYRFKRAVQRAERKKVGMWSDYRIRNCFLATPDK